MRFPVARNHFVLTAFAALALCAGARLILVTAQVDANPPGTWTAAASMNQSRDRFSGALLPNGEVLVAGGWPAVSSAELYSPAANTWTVTGSMALGRSMFTAVLLSSGQVLAAGGFFGEFPTAKAELYNPATGTWSATGSMNVARENYALAVLPSGQILVAGGATAERFLGVTNSAEIYNPSTGKWTNAASTSTFRLHNGTTLLSDGKVLVTGGANGRSPIPSAELYDPTHNTWTLTRNMTSRYGRYAHTATLLGDGTVMVAGGYGQLSYCGPLCFTFIPTATAEIYNEATGQFTAAGSLSQALAYQSATLSAQGVALVAGGITNTSPYYYTCCVVVKTAEFYTPLSLTFSPPSLNFGFMQVGQTSATQTVTVSNVSNHSVSFSSITHSANFNESNNCPIYPSTLQIKQSCTITVSFSPTVAGSKSGTVTLNDNAPGSPHQTIALSGTGAAGALTFTVPSVNMGSVTPPPPNSSYASATLINDSAVAVSITGVSIAPARAFTSTNNCPAKLNPQETCVFQLTFTPPDSGNYSATLTVTDNGTGPSATLKLSGIGLD